MKESQYNFSVNHNNRIIFYNAITGDLLSFTENEFENISILLKNLSLLEVKYPSLLQYFIRTGFVIKDGVNELDIVKFRNNQNVFLDKEYRLVINPTLECNFNCWYCYERHCKGRMGQKTMNKIKKHVNLLIDNKQIDSLHLDWFGGEPLLYFNEVIFTLASYFQKISKKKNISYRNTITTNGYLITEEMINQFKKTNFNFFQITLDGNKEQHNKIRRHYGKDSYDVIINNVILLCKEMKDVEIVLRLNYSEKTMENDFTKDLEIIPLEYRKKITVDFQRIWQTYDSKKDRNQWKIDFSTKVRKMGFYYKGLGHLFPYKGISCYVDKLNHLEINFDGQVYKCTARGYDKKYVVAELLPSGELLWKENELSKRFSNPTFQNEMCLKCKCLPICIGPCSQKIFEVKTNHNLENICTLKLSEYKIEDYIIDCYESLMDYRKTLIK